MSRAVTKKSLAKKALCAEVGIHVKKFVSLLRAAHVRAALVEHFRKGALLFVPNNTGG
jgi:hypothetical protein